MFSICVWPLATEMDFFQHEQKSMLNYLKHNCYLKSQKSMRVWWSSANSPVLSDEGTKAKKGEVSFPRSHRELIMTPRWDPGLLTPRPLFFAFSLLIACFLFQQLKGNSDSISVCFYFGRLKKIQNQLFYPFLSDSIRCPSIFPRRKIYDYNSQTRK